MWDILELGSDGKATGDADLYNIVAAAAAWGDADLCNIVAAGNNTLVDNLRY